MDFEKLLREARKTFEFGGTFAVPYLERQFPAFSLFQDLRYEYAEKFSVTELNTLLLQTDPQFRSKGSFWEIGPENWRDSYKHKTTVAEELAFCLASAVAHSIAPEWSLAPGTTWEEWKKQHPEKGWL